ncbi:hypothetical protein [Lysinibacillus xylanilyticus]|uniref:hypothetical protein n=1 Tax=Lysinibacillus xylanilyticus TaxID=582475 RepID=UPI0038050EA0
MNFQNIYGKYEIATQITLIQNGALLIVDVVFGRLDSLAKIANINPMKHIKNRIPDTKFASFINKSPLAYLSLTLTPLVKSIYTS